MTPFALRPEVTRLCAGLFVLQDSAVTINDVAICYRAVQSQPQTLDMNVPALATKEVKMHQTYLPRYWPRRSLPVLPDRCKQTRQALE